MENQNNSNKNIFTAVLAMAAAFAVFIAVFFALKNIVIMNPVSDKSAYEIAVEDAVFAEKDEIETLVSITKDSPMVTWNEDGTKVLVLSWHKYPESYPDGSSFVCEYGEVWTFTDKEILSWYQANNEGVTDWNLRLKQVIGLPEDKEYTHFTAFWADPDELIRPAYQTDITMQLSESDLDGSGLGEYEEWFDGNTLWSYFDSAYPWTRLGYTYDWADDGVDYGLTEFIILPDSTVEVEWTVSTEEFISMLESGSLQK